MEHSPVRQGLGDDNIPKTHTPNKEKNLPKRDKPTDQSLQLHGQQFQKAHAQRPSDSFVLHSANLCNQ